MKFDLNHSDNNQLYIHTLIDIDEDIIHLKCKHLLKLIRKINMIHCHYSYNSPTYQST